MPNKFENFTLYDGVDGVIANFLLELGKPVNKENIEKAKRDFIKVPVRNLFIPWVA